MIDFTFSFFLFLIFVVAEVLVFYCIIHSMASIEFTNILYQYDIT